MTIYHSSLEYPVLREYASEWRKRGLTPPERLEAIVHARVLGQPNPARDPRYEDFFRA